jgi:hypothetical protein
LNREMAGCAVTISLMIFESAEADLNGAL